MAKLTIKTIDRLSLPSSMSIGVPDAVTNAQVTAITTAMDSLVRGAACGGTVTVSTDEVAQSLTAPNDVEANRSSKWLFRFQDSVTGIVYPHEMGVADYTNLASATSDYVDLTSGAGLAMKTALDAVYRSKAGNSGVLLSIQQVGRTG